VLGGPSWRAAITTRGGSFNPAVAALGGRAV
jgi:hypothetical protein